MNVCDTNTIPVDNDISLKNLVSYSSNTVEMLYFSKPIEVFFQNIDFVGQVGQKILIRAGNTPQYLPRRRSQNVQISAAAAVASCFLDFFKNIIQHDFTCVNYGVEYRYPHESRIFYALSGSLSWYLLYSIYIRKAVL